MGGDVATLGLAVDSGPVDKGTASLDGLTNAAKKAEAAAAGVSSSYANAGKKIVSAADAASRAMDEQTSSAMRAANANARLSAAVNDNAKVHKAAYIPTANLAAQFQDIGVSAAMSMNPLQIALQQGTQISAVLGPLGAAGAVKALGGAFLSVISPVSLLVIAAVALVAAGLQMVNWAKVGTAALTGIANVLQPIAPYAAAAAAGIALLYAPQILMGLVQVVAAISRVVASLVILAATAALANPFTAILLGAVAAVTAATVFRDEFARILGVDIVAYAKTGANYVIGSFVAAFNDIKFLWANFPTILGSAAIGAANMVVSAMETMINKSAELLNAFIRTANAGLAKLPGGLQIPEAGTVKFGGIDNPYAAAADKAGTQRAQGQQEDLSRDYIGEAGGAIGKGASAASTKLKALAADLLKVDDASKKKGGKSDAEKYDDIIDGANRRIASLNAERQAVGMTEEASARLRAETDLFNQAQQKGLTLTDAQRSELSALAASMAAVEVETRKAKESLDFAKDATKGFISDLRQGLMSGQSAFQAFGNAANNVLNKIISKIEDQLVNALFSAGSATSGAGGAVSGVGGLLGGLGKLFGFAAGGYTGGGASSKVAGVVHGGEYVFSKKATDRIGVSNLDGMHKRAKGYAAGGYVARSMPAANSNSQQAVPVQIGVTVDDDGRIKAYVKKEGDRSAMTGATAGAAVALNQTPSLSLSSVSEHQRRRG